MLLCWWSLTLDIIMLKVVVLTVNLYLNMYVLDPFLWQKKNHLHVFTYNYKKKHQTHTLDT